MAAGSPPPRKSRFAQENCRLGLTTPGRRPAMPRRLLRHASWPSRVAAAPCCILWLRCPATRATSATPRSIRLRLWPVPTRCTRRTGTPARKARSDGDQKRIPHTSRPIQRTVVQQFLRLRATDRDTNAAWHSHRQRPVATQVLFATRAWMFQLFAFYNGYDFVHPECPLPHC